MSKFNHNFVLKSSTDFSRVYCEDCTNIQLDFVDKNIIRVAIYNANEELVPTFSINPTNEFSVNGRNRLSVEGFNRYSPTCEKTEKGECINLDNGFVIYVNEGDFSLSYYKNSKRLFADRNPAPYNFNNEYGKDLIHYISREENEKIFGLGDKGGELNKSGRAFRIETADSMGYNAKTTDILYKHIPFYICENSVGCYGIFYDTSATSYMDLGNEINNYYAPYKYFKTEDNALIYYVFFGTKLEILQSFCKLCGKQPLPPKWSFKYCASTMAYTDAPDSENQMNEFLHKLDKYDLSCGGFYLSSGYTSIGEGRYVFNWNTDKFPKPERFIENFNNNGINLIPNIKPAFLLSHPMYEEIKERGLFVKNQDGTPFVTRFWDGNGSYLDFTNPNAYEFWKNQVKEKLLDLGIKATWNDNNEFDIKDTDAITYNGSSASKIRPHFTELMVMSSYEAQVEKYPKLRPFLSTRSGGVGVRRLAQTWSGDNRTAFEDLRYCHNIGLTMSMSGLMFYGHDLGGFSGDMPSRELLLRWLQHGIFEPRMTIHSWNKDGSATMPWSYEDAIDSIKALFKQREMLLPYLYSQAYKCVKNDIPINAPLCLYYDMSTEVDAMMFGTDILVPFIFDKGKTQTKIRLPKESDWYLGDKFITGGETVTLEIPAESEMPYFVKSGAVIPIMENGELIFTVYPLKNGIFESDFFDDDGLSFEYQNNNCTKLHFTVECNENQVTVQYENRGNQKLIPKVMLIKNDKDLIIVD